MILAGKIKKAPALKLAECNDFSSGRAPEDKAADLA